MEEEVVALLELYSLDPAFQLRGVYPKLLFAPLFSSKPEHSRDAFGRAYQAQYSLYYV